LIDLKFVKSRLRFIFNLKFISYSNSFKMASFPVHFIPGFPLPQSNLLQLGGKRQKEERRGYCGGLRNKMRLRLRNSDARWRRMFRRELLRREGNFPECKLSGFCSGGIRNTQSISGNRFYVAPAVFYSSRAPCGC
jgi:hypothetical protein